MENHRYWCVIPAAGAGTRFGAQIPKQYISIAGKTILEHTLECVLNFPRIEKIVLVLDQHDKNWPSLSFHSEKIITTYGGESRQHSVLNGLKCLESLAQDNDWILVHDAVRPCLQHEDINKLIAQVQQHAVGGILAVPSINTLKYINENNEVVHTLDRKTVWQALTPQMFRYKKLCDVLNRVNNLQMMVTDEAAAFEVSGEYPKVIEGRRDNIKITYPEDLMLAEWLLRNKK